MFLSDLIALTREGMLSFGQSQSTRYQYDLAWRWLSDYFDSHSQTTFSVQLAYQYVNECRKNLGTRFMKMWRYKLIRRSTQFLKEYFEHGSIEWKYNRYDGKISLIQIVFIRLKDNFLLSLKENRKGFGSIRLAETISKQFLQYLEQTGHIDIDSVDLKVISQFIAFISQQYQPTSMRTVLSVLRSLLRYIESEALTNLTLSNAVPKSFGRKTVIVPTITYKEEKKLLKSIDRDTVMGKRNLAMFLLALRMGLRSVDIINLKLDDVKWKQNNLEIIQKKTGVSLVLPLLTDVGNAVADYILNGRPVSVQPYIFLRSQAPYRKIADHSACYGISRKLMKDAGIRQKSNDRKGFHCLRHSTAARLLKAGTPLPVISSILGHRDKDSTKIYLSTDLEHLRACALGLDGLEVTREELE